MLYCRKITLAIVTLLLGHSSIAQQNLFNVPSSDITIKGKPFFQQQLNFVNDGNLLLNSTFCYGLGNDFEIGVNVLGVFMNFNNPGSALETNSDNSNPPVYPFFTINAQKEWGLNKTFKLAIGTQTGLSVGGHFGTYDYLNVVTAIPSLHLKLITGLNYGSESFLGHGELNGIFPYEYIPFGLQVGLEQELIKEKLLFIAEHISGDHSLGLSALGLGYHLTDHWVLSLGYQYTNNAGNSPNSVIFEFTFVPSAISHRRVYHEGHTEEE